MKSMFLGRLLASAGIAAALGLVSFGASAYSSVVIFGDSLSDSGNNALVLGTDPGQVITGNTYVPTFPYASGTYSNGNVWATSFAGALGLSALPSLAGGTDYAYGGASTRGFGYPPSLRTQVTKFLGTSPSDAADTLFVIAGGGNNARAALEAIAGGAPQQRTVATAARHFASDVGMMVDQLQGIGAQHIVVWDTPDIGATPAVQAGGSGAAALGTSIATQMNIALAGRLVGEAGVSTFDIFGLVDSVVANPAAYGLSNVTDACGAIAGCNPSQYLYWDGIHPTSAGHSIIADAMLANVMLLSPVPEPQTAWLFAAGLVLLVVRRRSNSSALQ